MAELPPNKDSLLYEEMDLMEQEVAEDANQQKSSGKDSGKHLDDSFDEFYLSQEGMLPEWMDG